MSGKCLRGRNRSERRCWVTGLSNGRNLCNVWFRDGKGVYFCLPSVKCWQGGAVLLSHANFVHLFVTRRFQHSGPRSEQQVQGPDDTQGTCRLVNMWRQGLRSQHRVMFASWEIQSEIRNESSVTHNETETWLIWWNKALKIPDKSEGNKEKTAKTHIKFLLTN